MSLPLVSIFCFCKNRAQTIRNAIDSLLAQTYPNIEIIVQDGASTDGTLETLQSYGDKIKLVSEPDSGPEEAFLTAFKRCNGQYIGSCLSDEQLLPHAAKQSVAYLEAHPQTGAIHGDMLLMDLDGKVYREAIAYTFHLRRFMHGDPPPNFSSAFFRRSALEKIGLWSREWVKECCEFDLWCRLGLEYPIDYIPGSISKYGTHGHQLSKNPEKVFNAFRGRIQVIHQLSKEYPDLFKNQEEINDCIMINGSTYVAMLRDLLGPQAPYADKIFAYIKKFSRIEKAS
jgi:glycosyltransferase involved in cell wall biosynthesis